MNGPSDLLAGLEVLRAGVAQLCSSSLERAIAIVSGRRRPPARRSAAELAQHPRQRAEMILVAVGDHDRLDVLGALAQIAEIWQHEVDPEHVGGREPQPGVDDDDPVLVLDHRHVLADLAQPAERQDAQLPAHRLSPPAGRDAGLCLRAGSRCVASSPWRSSMARTTESSGSSSAT